MSSNRFFGTALVAAMVTIPVFVQGCSDENNPLCCTEFKAGGEIDANISSNVQAQVAAQAVADLSGLATAAVSDLTNACRNIATDLGADRTAREAADAQTGSDAMKAWCDLAVKAIGTVKAKATIKVEFQPPQCQASVSAKASCQAKCDVSGKCDIKANPPKCTGGKLEVACKGECSVTAQQPKISCTGKCEASCTGRCAASATAPSVKCTGKCNGTCTADAQAGGSGIQADGTCNGRCDGTCEVTPGSAGVECEGSCDGECTGSCTAEGGVAAKCSGECKADFEPLSCEGGKLEGGCQVDAKCDANCDASVKAKAECTPPKVAVVVEGSANAAAIVATLEANLPLVFRVSAHLEGAAQIGGTVSGNISGFAEIKPACIPVLAEAAATSVAEFGAALTASVSVTGSVGAK